MGDQRNRYRFLTEWAVSAPNDDVFAALAELLDYPKWWPEVRSAVATGTDRCQMTIRAILPYDLTFVSVSSRIDARAGILEAALSGDLEGMSRWTITETAVGTTAVFVEEVVAHKKLLRRLAVIARPAFRANHALMMSHGRQGLETYLAGMRLGRATASGPVQQSVRRA